jgi:hypothetical protein
LEQSIYDPERRFGRRAEIGSRSLLGILGLAHSVLQHLNVRPRQGAGIALHSYPPSKALDNGFTLLRRQGRKPKLATLLLVRRKKPRNLTFRHLPSLTTLPPRRQREKCFEVASRSGVLLGSLRKLTLFKRSIMTALFPTEGDRLSLGF